MQLAGFSQITSTMPKHREICPRQVVRTKCQKNWRHAYELMQAFRAVSTPSVISQIASREMPPVVSCFKSSVEISEVAKTRGQKSSEVVEIEEKEDEWIKLAKIQPAAKTERDRSF